MGSLALVDHDHITLSGLNRDVGATSQDVADRTPKVEVCHRVTLSISESMSVDMIADSLLSDGGFDVVKSADTVFGCVDRQGVRFILNELCRAYDKPYFDLATDILMEGTAIYGGHVFFTSPARPGCLVCHGLLDDAETQLQLGGPRAAEQHEEIYGVPASALEGIGPSVVSLNGVVASLAVTEFMLEVTDVRRAQKHLVYRGNRGIVTTSTDPTPEGCYYCTVVKGAGAEADVERYLAQDLGL